VVLSGGIVKGIEKNDSILKLEKNCFYIPVWGTVLYLGNYVIIAHKWSAER
jgi:hypothetical protein